MQTTPQFTKKIQQCLYFRQNSLWPLGLSVLLVLCSSMAFGQVSGKVFKDFNANGVFNTSTSYNEVGMAGVVVKATNPAGTALTVTYTSGTATTSTGAYTVTGGTLGQIRLEFVLPDMLTFASKGATGGTNILFPSGATQDLAVNSPEDYWNNAGQPIPQLVVPCYINGTITNPGSIANTGIVQIGNDQNGITGLTMNEVAKASQVGTVWGEAYQKSNDRFFFSAFLKRNAGFGPKGPGGVYIGEKNGSGVYKITASFDLQSVIPSNSATAIDLGTVTRVTSPATADNYLAVAAKDDPSRDLDAFAKVGTISYGDIDIDEAHKLLFLTDLKQNRLLAVDVSGGTTTLGTASAATLGSLTKAYAITLPSGTTCTGGSLRPWGLKIYKGKGYLGVICDGMTSQTNADLKGYILTFDPTNVSAGFTKILTLDMSYRDPTFWTNFVPWTSTWTQAKAKSHGYTSGGTETILNCQPTISDIEFNENGDMTIGIMDRFGNQMGAKNYTPLAGNTTLIDARAYGDILQARKNASGTWVLEGTTGTIAPNFTAANNIASGYGNVSSTKGEYYNDRAGDGSEEAVMGSLVKIMGTDKIVATIVDPYPVTATVLNPYYDSGGLHWFNTTTGAWDQYATLYSQDYGVDFGKAVGLGDLEAALSPAPIEIGNRVWDDTDKDGVQDAGEAGLSGVTVTLCLASAPSTPVATATTDASGNYYFSSATGTNTASAIYGLNLTFNSNYILKFPTTSGTKSLTTKDLGGNDLTDSDAAANGQIAFTTGSAGENDHSFDVGYYVCTKPAAGNDQAPTCVGTTAITTATLAATAVSGGAWTQAASNPAGAVVSTPASATSGITGLTPGVY
jgi:hypothetical protein